MPEAEQLAGRYVRLRDRARLALPDPLFAGGGDVMFALGDDGRAVMHAPSFTAFEDPAGTVRVVVMNGPRASIATVHNDGHVEREQGWLQGVADWN